MFIHTQVCSSSIGEYYTDIMAKNTHEILPEDISEIAHF